MRTRLVKFTNYLLEHRLRAVLLTFVVSFIPVLGLVGIVFATLVTLRKGMIEGALVTAATMPYFVYAYYSGSTEASLPMLIQALIGIAVLSNVLTWVFAGMLRKQAPWSQVLQVAALFGVLVISVIHLAMPEVIDWWGNQLTELQSYINQKMVTAGLITDPQLTEEQLSGINSNKQSADGIIIGAMLFNAVLQLVAARWWQALAFNPGLLRRELHHIRLSRLAGLLFLLSLFFAYLGNSVVVDLMPVLYLLFGAAGLSLVHYLFGLMRPPSGLLWLVAMYVVIGLALLMGWVMIWAAALQLIALLGLVDIWLDIRKRLKK